MPIGSAQVCERRTTMRHSAHFVAKIRPMSRRREYLGVTQNVGVNGALVVTRANFAPGERVEIDLYIGESCYTLRGRVVRAALLDRTRIGVWKSEAAVEFDEASVELEPRLREAARKQASFSLGRAGG